VTVTIEGLPPGRVTVTHDRIDDTHSNAYAAWVRMGSPQSPTPAQHAALEQAGRLQALRPARQATVGADGRITETFDLPRKSVSFVTVTW
jgi:xylan 1,4-beta-xylosidase